MQHCVQSTVFVFQSFHEQSIVFKVRCLCYSHSKTTLLCSE